MSLFKLKSEKKKGLTIKDIEDLGWLRSGAIKEHDIRSYFVKDNYFLSVYEHTSVGPILYIMARDPCQIDWMPDPENFRITIPCPTKESLKNIMNLLNIK